LAEIDLLLGNQKAYRALFKQVFLPNKSLPKEKHHLSSSNQQNDQKGKAVYFKYDMTLSGHLYLSNAPKIQKNVYKYMPMYSTRHPTNYKSR